MECFQHLKETLFPYQEFFTQICSRNHWKNVLSYMKNTKLHKKKIVGGKKFPEWHLSDAEDTQTRQNSETQEKDMLRVVTIEIPLGRMLGWAQVLMCACFPWPHADEVLALPRVPAPASSEYIYFTPKCLLLLRAGGGNWWSYGAAHFFWLYSCWRSPSRPTL